MIPQIGPMIASTTRKRPRSIIATPIRFLLSTAKLRSFSKYYEPHHPQSFPWIPKKPRPISTLGR